MDEAKAINRARAKTQSVPGQLFKLTLKMAQTTVLSPLESRA